MSLTSGVRHADARPELSQGDVLADKLVARRPGPECGHDVCGGLQSRRQIAWCLSARQQRCQGSVLDRGRVPAAQP